MRLRITPLEERIVLDAAGLPGDVDQQDAQEAQSVQEMIEAEAQDAAPAENAEAESAADPNADSNDPEAMLDAEGDAVRVLAISSNAGDAEALAAAAMGNVMTVLFDAETGTPESVLDQIQDALDGQQADSIAFATHSAGNGGFTLTHDAIVNENTLFGDARLTQFWEGIGALLDDDGRIDLLACNLTDSVAGESLVADLEALTGHEVAASDDVTGNVHSGDWMLEMGNIDLLQTYFDGDAISQFAGRLATTWFVDGDSTATRADDGHLFGLTWATAYADLDTLLTDLIPDPDPTHVQNLYDASDDAGDWDYDYYVKSGDTIWVADGDHALGANAGSVFLPYFYDFRPDDGAVVHRTDIQIYGGFAGQSYDADGDGVADVDRNGDPVGETYLEERDWAANVTTLKGDANSNFLDLTAGMRLDGFHITGANGGSAIHVVGDNVVVTNNVFHDNVAVRGSALMVSGVSPHITNNVFENNGDTSVASPTRQGGAIYISSGDGAVAAPEIVSNVFYNNEAISGGAIYATGFAGESYTFAEPHLVNNLFNNNAAALNGMNGGAPQGNEVDTIVGLVDFDEGGTRDDGAQLEDGVDTDPLDETATLAYAPDGLVTTEYGAYAGMDWGVGNEKIIREVHVFAGNGRYLIEADGVATPEDDDIILTL
ncbi:MAG: DUF4347 domain-containing protein, partial [Planctomycetota bacterium]